MLINWSGGIVRVIFAHNFKGLCSLCCPSLFLQRSLSVRSGKSANPQNPNSNPALVNSNVGPAACSAQVLQLSRYQKHRLLRQSTDGWHNKIVSNGTRPIVRSLSTGNHIFVLPLTTQRYSILSAGAPSQTIVQVPSPLSVAGTPPLGSQDHQGR